MHTARNKLRHFAYCPSMYIKDTHSMLRINQFTASKLPNIHTVQVIALSL